ncbi:EAL domain-containing protein [Vibrio hannami]|uniref:EAL domain-containing protein n=1 Tax=Vibrio hannami TaxID=2717094 RepID=UPI00240F0A9A|nr:EAL domain-containing protein [Vibrio hannami]MDG3085363.1 EAL domain-containing protein [Vibrio hannami]
MTKPFYTVQSSNSSYCATNQRIKGDKSFARSDKCEQVSAIDIAELWLAIERNELELFFQPQLNLDTGKIRGAEALVRWNHPSRGLLAPDQFLYLIGESSINVKLGEWVLETAIRIQSERKDDLSISINITPYHLQQETFFTSLVNTLLKYPDSNPEMLTIELTETTCISDFSNLERSMKNCRKLGVKFSLDDFGTGYSTFSQLGLLPISELKVDKSFVQALDADVKIEKMVEGVVLLADFYGVDVVAEGIETSETLLLVKGKKCTIGQGYFYSKPMPYQRFNSWVKQHSSKYFVNSYA